jgi:hypothetical protein
MVIVVIAPVLFILSGRRNHDAMATIGQNLLNISAISYFFPSLLATVVPLDDA